MKFWIISTVIILLISKLLSWNKRVYSDGSAYLTKWSNSRFATVNAQQSLRDCDSAYLSNGMYQSLRDCDSAYLTKWLTKIYHILQTVLLFTFDRFALIFQANIIIVWETYIYFYLLYTFLSASIYYWCEDVLA